MLTIDTMIDQVKRSLEGNNLTDFNIDGIVNDLIRDHGLCHIDTIPGTAYWITVFRHDAAITSTAWAPMEPFSPVPTHTTVKTEDLKPGMRVRPAVGCWPGALMVTEAYDARIYRDWVLTFDNGWSFRHSKGQLWIVENASE